MAIGPVEYMVVAFPGNHFNGDVAPALGSWSTPARSGSSTSRS